MSDATKPTPDRAEILRSLAVLFEPDDVIELRAFPKGRKIVSAGYYDGEHREALADAAARLNAAGATVCVTLNRIDPQLLGRYRNRIEQGGPSTASDANVIRRRWLLIDLDPARPKDTAATEAQVEAARDRARMVFAFLRSAGWPDPVVAESGNGQHLLYPLDMPNDAGSTAAVKGALDTLAAQFDHPAVTVDRSVFNAARIMKLYGTTSTKGDHGPDAPWRLSKIVSAPTRDAVVTVEMLRALAPKPEPVTSTRATTAPRGDFDLDVFLRQLGIDFEADRHDGRERFKLARCPFNPDHGRGEAAIFRAQDGRLGFKCQHNSCATRTWIDVRALVDGARETRRAPPQQYSVEGSAAAVEGLVEWPDPVPLPKLPGVPTFNSALLPDTLVGWIEDISDRARYPREFPAVAAMVGLGSTIGRKIGIRLKAHDDWTEHANVWGMIVGVPSALKSPASRDALKPLRRLQVEADRKHAEAMAEWEAKEEGAKIRKKEAKRRASARAKEVEALDDIEVERVDSEDSPVVRTYLTSDFSVEQLGVLLEQDSTGILLERDELSGLLSHMEREEQATARGFLLSGWSGKDGYRWDRVIRGKTALSAFALSVFGGIQPGPLERYVRGAASGERADGFLQRFQLAVWPDLPAYEYVDRWPLKDLREEVWQLFQHADTFDPVAMGLRDDGSSDPPYVRLASDAQGIFADWMSGWQAQRRGAEENNLESVALTSHFGKFPGLLGKLALILHVADGNPADPSRVSKRTLLKALAWLEYLEGHARRIYHAAENPATGTAALLLARIRRGALPESFKARDVYRAQWSGLTDAERVKAACGLLAQYDWIAEVPSEARPGGGRPRDPVYRINPKAAEAQR